MFIGMILDHTKYGGASCSIWQFSFDSTGDYNGRERETVFDGGGHRVPLRCIIYTTELLSLDSIQQAGAVDFIITLLNAHQ